MTCQQLAQWIFAHSFLPPFNLKHLEVSLQTFRGHSHIVL